ncbi:MULTISPECIES: DUF2284 domain-containing protein [Eubacterium]|uniref:Predicted metal-binding protein n=1 Tax=Eubacterium barkeri TaxID=1528 RepID=A0A1H3DA03_EUBBA|nr:DUF2284 domain-containing protein [Eubacterium barkeri]SDX62978.1 Predicted metal-binding protein [Eubacterium barkeri]
MSMDLTYWKDQARGAGFSEVAALKMETLVVNPEVRKMCAANACGQYGKNWACPPGCGDLEECASALLACDCGLIVQTVAQLEDSFDFEGMAAAGSTHWENFSRLRSQIQENTEKAGDVLALAAGSCTHCKTCAYPDAPCRFPEAAASSVEAYGLLVNQLCVDNGLAYNYGEHTIAYTALFLFKG